MLTEVFFLIPPKNTRTNKKKKIKTNKNCTFETLNTKISSPEISNLGQIENDNVYAFYYVFMLIFTPRFTDEPMNVS